MMYLFSGILIFTLLSAECVLGAEPTYTMNNINYLIDDNLPLIRQFMRKLHFDPLKLPDIIDEWVSPLYVSIKNGTLRDLGNFKTRGNALLAFYDGKEAQLQAKLRFAEINGEFDYLAKRFLFRNTGNINVTMSNITVQLDANFTVNLERILLHRELDIISNATLKILDFDKVEVKVIDDGFISAVKELAINLAVPWYKGKIIDIAEKEASKLLDESVVIVNDRLRNLSAQDISKGYSDYFNHLRMKKQN